MRTLIMVLALSTTGLYNSSAQTISIEGVQKAVLRNNGAIKEDTEVKGYYFFYISDKVDKKTNEYTLRIVDNNLKILKDVKFEDSKDISLLESSFNGTDLIFLMYNDKERTFDYVVYGADGQKKPFDYNRELTKKEKRYLELTYLAMDEEENNYKGLYPVQGKGFISNMPSRENKDYTFQIDYFSTEKRKTWTYTPTEGGKRFMGDYLGCYNGTIFIEVLRLGGTFDQKPDSYIIGLDIETGKQIFEKATDARFRYYPTSLSILNNGKAYLFGEYFDLDGNVWKDRSLGFAFVGIDEKGNITNEKYNSWENEMSKHMNVSSKGKIEDFGYAYMHKMVQASDGNIYAIGEGFKKVASALGIASTLLSGGGRVRASTTKIKVTDMVTFKFDKDFNIKDAQFVEKKPNSIELPGGYDFVSLPMLGKMIKYNFGGFDYAYTQTNKDVSSFTVCYSDYVKEKDYKGGTFNSISYNDGKFSTDKINTKTDATRTWVLPAKQGQVLLMEYFKKAKKLEAHFEKLN